ncbi:MAG: hypothetical protein DMG57_23160 [Acidobacteria bacterium]|nr:MAG: hypothetical protein DMG57_23160 [Acidobacteriota bacterium]
MDVLSHLDGSSPLGGCRESRTEAGTKALQGRLCKCGANYQARIRFAEPVTRFMRKRAGL